MTSDTYIPAAIVLAIVVGAVAAAPIGFISFQIGRRSARKTTGQDITLERRPPKASESLLSELKNLRCLVTGIARDADTLSSIADRSSGRLPAELNSALAQLLQAIGELTSQTEQVANENSAGDIVPAENKAAAVKIERGSHADQKSAESRTAALAPAEQDETASSSASEANEVRKFPRSPCLGSLKATIYPPPFRPGGAPLECTVLIRDLSRGGIGISHSEKLYPKQIIVLHAMTKLLVGEVRWCRQTSEQSYIAGCALVKASG